MLSPPQFPYSGHHLIYHYLFEKIIKKTKVPYCYGTLFKVKVYEFVAKKSYKLDCKHNYPSSEHILPEEEVA